MRGSATPSTGSTSLSCESRGNSGASQYDASPDATLAAIRAHEGPLLVDFDETLYLSNSTEDFLDCAWPGLLALALLRALDAFKPWRLTGGSDTGDNWRVCAIQIFFPWTRFYVGARRLRY